MLLPTSLNIGEIYSKSRLHLPISYSEFVTIVSRSRHISKFPHKIEYTQADIMGSALNTGWYDWDEIPPTGELYDKPIPRKIAARILAAVYFPDVKGDYSKWSEVLSFKIKMGGPFLF